ncbi:glycerophosphodiester phosphodiesterase [Aggregatimonas sangjinii]|uniref:Glycerophosphodiester phosphodiesterase n=2 Tax=Aggregatimonas sangjinii TaxID=2583587 RepID=A0A5B7SNR6_9FLAO|nr:glycerophosphodiester phosphodiesterase [Aggregatimonas sangjinii]
MRFLVTIFSLFLFLSCTRMNEPLIIGHRGAMGHETENTLASVQKALDLGVDGIEIDVFNIESGETVVFHDERVERLTNGGGRVEEYNYVDLLQLTLDGNHKIPMLQDVLKLIDNKVLLNIELKGAGTSDRVNFIMNYYIEERGWSPENFLISSFNWDELREMRKINPDVAIAVLTEDDPLEAIPEAIELKAVAINPDYEKLTSENNLAIKDAGFKIYAWTVNEPQDIIKMKRFGVDGIITNYPERIR